MEKIDGLISSLKNIDSLLRGGQMLREVFLSKEEAFNEMMCGMQRRQLMSGERSDGERMRPSYFEDPFFKSKESARRYANYKAKVFGTADRHYSSPNLYINGYFHAGFRVRFGAESVEMDNGRKVIAGRSGRTQNLYEKYGKSSFGLNPGNWGKVLEEAAPLLIEKIREAI